jgi:hypothetical protein
MEEFFVQSDLNKDGYLSIEDFKMWGDNLEQEVKADASQWQRQHFKSGGRKKFIMIAKIISEKRGNLEQKIFFEILVSC